MNVFERLEARQLYSSTAPFYVNENGSLIVNGSTSDDVIYVRSSKHTFNVSVNELRDFVFNEPVVRVIIEGAGGNDRIAYEGQARVPVVVLGGNGNDRLEGVGPNILLGGGRGNDALYIRGTFGATLSGGLGRDRMVGGSGPDFFDGGDGDDYASVVVSTIDQTVDVEEMVAVA